MEIAASSLQNSKKKWVLGVKLDILLGYTRSWVGSSAPQKNQNKKKNLQKMGVATLDEEKLWGPTYLQCALEVRENKI
jgi:hypothetical protein